MILSKISTGSYMALQFCTYCERSGYTCGIASKSDVFCEVQDCLASVCTNGTSVIQIGDGSRVDPYGL